MNKTPDNYTSDDEFDENGEYIFKTKICRRLSKILGVEDIELSDTEPYEPPKEHGLSNCNTIIPSYYNLDKDPSKIFAIDYHSIIQDDIRNFRPLNEYQIKYIKELPDDLKNGLFDIFNESVKAMIELLNNA
jgi:hypothetical protein